MKTLAERLQWLAEKCGSGRALSVKASLSGGHVGVLLTRLRRDPEANIEGKTIVALAEAGGVSVAWLMSGEGEPTSARPEDRRQDAARLAREDGVHDAAIVSVLGDPLPTHANAITTLEWTRRMKMRELEMWNDLPPRSDSGVARGRKSGTLPVTPKLPQAKVGK